MRACFFQQREGFFSVYLGLFGRHPNDEMFVCDGAKFGDGVVERDQIVG